jgi:hypothetical protein
MESYLFPAFRQMWFAKNISGEMALRSKALITVAKYPDGGMAMTFPTLKTWQRNRHCLLDVVQRTRHSDHKLRRLTQNTDPTSSEPGACAAAGMRHLQSQG